MRMEELSDSRYIKGTDAVERYLLNLVQEYFKNSNIAATTSREYIIKKAVERMKEEITFDSIGVLSITLPSGETKTGAVTITLEDLNGEPLISPKLSAFNVNFGTEQNTACEGNDPRLSDARKPLEHQHDISDIMGLEGILSSAIGKAERVSALSHSHSNKNVIDMLVYTGDKSSIDLAKMETLEDKVIELVQEIQQEVIDYRQQIDNEIADINSIISTVDTKVSTIKQYVLDTNKEYYELSKSYSTEKVNAAQEQINVQIENFITKDMLDSVLEAANNVYTYVGSMSFVLKDEVDLTKDGDTIIGIGGELFNLLTIRGQSLQDCQIEAYIEFYNPYTNKTTRASLPYILMNDMLVSGSLQVSTLYETNQIMVSFHNSASYTTELIENAKVIYKVYAKELVTL